MKFITILGFFFISLLGTLLHFVYEKSNHNKVVGIFGAVNESTWEHIKMALTPAFLWCLIDGFYFGNEANYFFAKLTSIVIIIITIPLIYYGYKLFSKKPILAIDVSTFFIAIILSQFAFYKILNMSAVSYNASYISVISLTIIFAFYLLATIFPLKNFIFQDPISKKYGITGHIDLPKKKKNSKSKKK